MQVNQGTILIFISNSKDPQLQTPEGSFRTPYKRYENAINSPHLDFQEASSGKRFGGKIYVFHFQTQADSVYLKVI